LPSDEQHSYLGLAEVIKQIMKGFFATKETKPWKPTTPLRFLPLLLYSAFSNFDQQLWVRDKSGAESPIDSVAHRMVIPSWHRHHPPVVLKYGHVAFGQPLLERPDLQNHTPSNNHPDTRKLVSAPSTGGGIEFRLSQKKVRVNGIADITRHTVPKVGPRRYATTAVATPEQGLTNPVEGHGTS
jgi:hypothetical protein